MLLQVPMLPFAKTRPAAKGMRIQVFFSRPRIPGALRPLNKRGRRHGHEWVRMAPAARADTTAIGKGHTVCTIEQMAGGLSGASLPLHLGNAPANQKCEGQGKSFQEPSGHHSLHLHPELSYHLADTSLTFPACASAAKSIRMLSKINPACFERRFCAARRKIPAKFLLRALTASTMALLVPLGSMWRLWRATGTPCGRGREWQRKTRWRIKNLKAANRLRCEAFESVGVRVWWFRRA